MKRIARTVTVIAGLLAAGAPVAAARPCVGGWTGVPETYTLLKLGRYGLQSLDGHAAFDSGMYLGVETGVSPSRYVELGVSVDWFHRSRAAGDVVVIDTSYDLPVESRLEVDGASTDLVPLGAVVRLRFPVGDGRFVPYVAGHVTYDILHLTSRRAVDDGGRIVLVEQNETFYGPGGTLALGVEARLDSHVGLVMEAGGHGSEPARDLVVDGVPLRGRVVADGQFARIGVRLGF